MIALRTSPHSSAVGAKRAERAYLLLDDIVSLADELRDCLCDAECIDPQFWKAVLVLKNAHIRMADAS